MIDNSWVMKENIQLDTIFMKNLNVEKKASFVSMPQMSVYDNEGFWEARGFINALKKGYLKVYLMHLY